MNKEQLSARLLDLAELFTEVSGQRPTVAHLRTEKGGPVFSATYEGRENLAAAIRTERAVKGWGDAILEHAGPQQGNPAFTFQMLLQRNK